MNARHRRRERPGRRPVRRRRPRRLGRGRLADAARGRAGRAARRVLLSAHGPDGVAACSIVSLVAARQDRRVVRRAVRRDADRVQVDRAGAGPRLRLRGGARLLRRPGRGEDKDGVSALLRVLRAGRAGQGRGAHAAGPAGRHRGRVRPARHRPAVRAGRRPVADHRPRWTGSGHSAASLGAYAVEQIDDLSRGWRPCRRPTGCATGWPTAPGSSSGRRAPSRS